MANSLPAARPTPAPRRCAGRGEGRCRGQRGMDGDRATLGQQTGRFVDRSHPRGLLAASMRNVGTDQSGPTGYEVMQ